jgi:RNA recognition motif-containing protein
MKIFVANLPFHIKEADLKQLFGLFGPVISAKIIMENGKSKGFGFLEMENEEQAQQAIRILDGSAIADQNIVVRVADDQSSTKKTHKRPRILYK